MSFSKSVTTFFHYFSLCDDDMNGTKSSKRYPFVIHRVLCSQTDNLSFFIMMQSGLTKKTPFFLELKVPKVIHLLSILKKYYSIN